MEISDDKVKQLMGAYGASAGSDGELELDSGFDEFDEFVSSYKFSPDFFTGSPSTPGFQKGEFDRLSNWALSTSIHPNRPVVAEYKPDDVWLWTKWEGSIKQMTWKTTVAIMLWALVVNMYAYYHYSTFVVGAVENVAWYGSEIRNSDDPLIELLQSVSVFWDASLSLGIFTLSFFVNQSYEHWKRVYFCARAIQGRINDLAMLVTAGAARSNECGEVDGVTGYQTITTCINDGKVIDSKKLVVDVTRMLRMSHAFFWAATPTASDGLVTDLNSLPEDFDPAQVGPKLLSREGLETLVRCEQLTQNEMDALLDTKMSPSQYHCILLEWALIRCMSGLRRGELVGGQGLEDNILNRFTQLRGEYFNVSRELSFAVSLFIVMYKNLHSLLLL
jgi:hypothetical protein